MGMRVTKSSQLFITLVRHGLSTANQAGIVQGQLDYPLHQDGKEQAWRLGEYWQAQGRVYETIICSPLQRAVETANLVATTLAIPIRVEPLWMERRFGEAEGLSYDRVREKYQTLGGSLSNTDPVFNGGESEWALFNRASKAIDLILRDEWKTSVVVSHGGILGAALRSILGIHPSTEEVRPPKFLFENTGFTDISFDLETSRWQILRHNAQPHLEFD